MLFIERELQRSGGIAPSLSEIADHFHYRSPPAARSLLTGLEARGHIRRLAGRDRAIEVLKPVSRLAVYRFDELTKSLTPLGAKS
jgi:SOS-response transcriptional repressor LexA